MLSKGKLAGLLHDRVFSTQNGVTFVEPMRRIAECYRSYASDARSCQAVGPVPASLAAAEATMAAGLAARLPTSRTPTDLAQIVGTAGAAFWLLPPVAFIGASPGLVIAAVPATLTAAILGVIANCAASGARLKPRQVADLWASALHTWTTSVVVLHGPLPTCSAPLT